MKGGRFLYRPVREVSQSLLFAGLIPNIFAAPTAQGTGSGNSDANATTMGDALTNAVAGDRVGMLPGSGSSFTRTNTADRFIPAFNPTNEGTAGNLITFVAKYPAAYNASNRTQLSNGVTSGEGCPTIGSEQKDYIRWIGPYIDGATSRFKFDTGYTVIHNCTGSEIHQCDIVGTPVAPTDNHNGLRLEDAIDAKFKNNRISGIRYTSGTSHNAAGIMTYGSRGQLIEHNEFTDCNAGVFVKGSTQSATVFNSGIYRFNKSFGNEYGMLFLEVHTGLEMVVEQNLLYDFNLFGLVYDNSASQIRNIKMRRNTSVVRSGTANPVWVENISSNNGHELDENLLVKPDNTAALINGGEYTGPNFVSIDGNHFYQGGGVRRNSWNGVDYTTVSAFESATGAASSTEGDPLFVDSANANFRLQGGSPAAGKGAYQTGNEDLGLQAVPTL